MTIFKTILGRIWAVWGVIWFFITMLFFMGPAIVIYYMPDPKRSHAFAKAARVWMAFFLPGIGCPLRIKGRDNFEKDTNYIVLCNHNSLMDVPISSPGIPGGNKTIAKIEMAKVPLFGFIYRIGSVLVDRKSETSRRESFNKMKQVLDMGLHMCIYPEGTRNKTDQPLKAFHDGAFRLAIATGKPIMPAVIFHTRKVNPAEKGFYLAPHALAMHFLTPIAVGSHHTVESLKQQVFDVMRNYYVANKGRD